jgi:transposase
MGYYQQFLIKVLFLRNAKLWLESPLRIKRSLGIQRGKNDKIDSLRIAQYAYLHRDNYIPWQRPRKEIQQLKQLSSLRERLITALGRLKQPLKESSVFEGKDFSNQLKSLCSGSVKALENDLELTNKKIISIVENDEKLHSLFSIITSVPHIGTVLGTELLIATNEFNNFTNAKKFASYCGIAPFERSSGTSTNSSARVSPLANKKIKVLLHMAALGTVSKKGELKEYYNRKISNGHSKMSVLNAIRNKIIHRVFACVREYRKYE